MKPAYIVTDGKLFVASAPADPIRLTIKRDEAYRYSDICEAITMREDLHCEGLTEFMVEHID